MTPLRPSHPFPGLRPFKYEESQLFFGRDGQVEKMIAKLSAQHFLGVVGTSGSGKSSLVFAGLLPALRSGMMPAAGSNWRIAVMRPGDDPIGNLARALNDPKVFGPAQPEYNKLQTAVTEITLRRGSRGLCECMQQNSLPQDPTKNLLVVVDQFEELFRYAREAHRANNDQYADDAAAFVKLLLEAVKPTAAGGFAQPLYVLLTMRSDFLGDCAQFWDLPEAINESQYLVPRLTRDQLREVIEGPIALCDGHITTRLVNHLLNDVGDRQDQLPILQHALMRTWDEWEREQGKEKGAANSAPMDISHFEAVGGLEHALSNHADEAYAELDARQQQIAKKLFQALTEKGEDNREIRRPVELQKLCDIAQASLPEVVAVIEAFRAPGRSFLMPPRDSKPELQTETRIDISHESLIRVWQRLRQWVNEEAEAAATYRRLADVAQRRAAGKAEALSGADLDAALQWQTETGPSASWAERYQQDFAGVMGLLADSQSTRATLEARQRAEREEKEAQRQRELKRTRLFAAILTAAFLVAAGAALFSYWQRQEAVRLGQIAKVERAEAVQQRERAEKSAASDRLNSQLTPLLNEMLFQGNDPLESFNGARDFFRQSGDFLGESVALAGLGDTYYRAQDFAQAEAHYQEALHLLQQRLPGHPYAARMLSKLGLVYSEREEYALAEPLFAQARTLLTQAFGQDNREVSATLSGLAKLYQKQGRYREAEALFKEVLSINERVLGADHQQFAIDQNYLALLYTDWNEPALAEPLFMQARQLLETKLGNANAKDATQLENYSFLYNSLASICLNQGALYANHKQFEQAEPLFKRALEVHEQLYGSDHPKVAIDLNNLAGLYLEQKKYADAIRLYERALPICVKTHGQNHENTSAVREGLSLARSALSKAGKDRPQPK